MANVPEIKKSFSITWRPHFLIQFGSGFQLSMHIVHLFAPNGLGKKTQQPDTELELVQLELLE
uniref:Uncharacterized protein n=1 Tax=Tolypothrix bouteillei VB521301 TaxID=1479485 RepID=A0A0C1RC76_9CYAN